MSETKFFPCADCLCFSLQRAARAATRNFDRHFKPLDLHATQFTLLALLAAMPDPLPMRELAERTAIERTTLTRNLAVLVRRRLIAVDEGLDRRVRLVAITAAGRRLARKALPLWHQAQAQALAALTPADRQQLLPALRRFEPA